MPVLGRGRKSSARSDARADAIVARIHPILSLLGGMAIVLGAIAIRLSASWRYSASVAARVTDGRLPPRTCSDFDANYPGATLATSSVTS